MKILITGFTNDYSIIYTSLKRSGFKKPVEIISLREQIHPMLKSLAREKEIPLKIFYFDSKVDWKEAILERNKQAIKYCNRLIHIGKECELTKTATELKKKTFIFEWWKD